MIQIIKKMRSIIRKYLPAAKIIKSVLHFDKTNTYLKNKRFINLIKISSLEFMFHEDLQKSHINKAGLHINRCRILLLTKNLILDIYNF